MSKAVCAECGGESLSAEVEIDSTGWRHLDVTYRADGTLNVKEGHTESNHDGDERIVGYECADCGATANKLEDLVGQDGLAGATCCCGHKLVSHKQQGSFDRKLYTRGRRSCAEPSCGCWEFETDPALATVVVQEAQAA